MHKRERQHGKHRIPKPMRLLAAAAGVLVTCGLVVSISAASAHDDGNGGELPPDPRNFVDIRKVRDNVDEPRRERDASNGTFVSECGRNENGHRNPDNYIVTPGESNGAHHLHDYVGNVSTNGFSTDRKLSKADTTCKNDDRSVFFWPVLRSVAKGKSDVDQNKPGGGKDGNEGKILEPKAVLLQFRGNPTGRVSEMPRFLRMITGDAKAATNGGENANAQWTCSDTPTKRTSKYPLCDSGDVQRILDFPSCWDGQNLDSKNHRDHVKFPFENGSCPRGTKAVPQLRMVLSYEIAPKPEFALDSFPEENHNPKTDHADFENLMPDALMERAVSCINRGQNCS